MNPRHARHGSRFSETQSVNASRFMPVAQAQESIPELMNNEIKEIRRFLHEKQFQSPFQQADAYQRPSNDFVQHRPPTLARRLTESRQSNAARPGLTPWCSDVQENIVTMLKDETVKNKTQIAILSLSLNRYLNNQDRLKIYQINKQIRILEQHESKVQEIMTMFQVIKKELHFAFLFASPIVIQQKDNSFKYFPQLNFTKEFIKIRESIHAAQVQINITKRQCTTDSLQEVLAQKPIGLHFSGHGILNNMDMGIEFFKENEGQGDFLVLENEKGGSELVSREQLKKMIRQNKCELEFVFVATCHSEFVGQIFQEAGAKHVICIKHSKEVKDEAVIIFTDTFYSMLFEQNKDICTAFQQAQLSVEISFTSAESEIFKLLLREDVGEETGRHSNNSAGKLQQPTFGEHDETIRSSFRPSRHGKVHACSTFGPFQKGRYNYVNHQIVHLPNRAPKMPKLMGRQKDMFRVIDKLLNSKNGSRLFNLIGWPGMGKSALVASILDYVSERGLLKGGSIYFNARNISMCEPFIHNFNQVLLSENPTLFGIAKERDQIKHEPIKTLESILAKIFIIDGDIILVIDNAEEIIQNERNDFSMLLSMMLTQVPQLKILLTSQRPLQRTLTYKEEKIILSNLSPIQSANLFKDVMARKLQQDEINSLLRTKPDPKKYPDEQHKWYKDFHDHHLFTLLNGNPQSIILVASLLADPQNKLTVKQVYNKLTDAQLFDLLIDEGIEKSDMISLRLSAQLSVQAIEETDPESVDLLYLLGLLPGGISPTDLDYLWGKVTQQNRKFHIEAKNVSAAGEHSNTSSKKSQKPQTKSTWRRAFAELKKGHLAEERQASRRAYNTQDPTKLNKSKTEISETTEDDESGQKDIVIILPELVRHFSEGKITDQMNEFFLEILSGWYKHQLHDIYNRNENIVYSAHDVSKQQLNVEHDFERLSENLGVFLIRMQEKYKEERFSEDVLRRSEKVSKVIVEDTSDSSSLTDDEMTVAEEMFTQVRGPAFSLPATGTPDTFRLSSVGHIGQGSTQTAGTMQTVSLTDAAAANEESGDIHTNFPELREAYLAVNERKPALERYKDAMKPKTMQHPREFSNPDEKALQYWRWAFEKVKNKAKEKKRIGFNMANVNMIGGENLDESFNSDFSQDEQDFEMKQQFSATKETSKVQDMNRRATIARRKVKELFSQPDNSRAMSFRRGTIKPLKLGQNSQAAFSRQTSRMSVYEARRNTMWQRDKGELTVDEKTMVYHLVNLILSRQFNVANSLIKKHYLVMDKCSNIFKANVRRFQALSLYRMDLSEAPDKKNNRTQQELRMQRLHRCLKRAEKCFKREKCAWGLGLTYFQQASMVIYQMEQRPARQRKGSVFTNQSSNSSLQNMNMHKSMSLRTNSLDQESARAKAMFLQAAEEFKKVNHWRGLYNTYRQLDMICGSSVLQSTDRSLLNLDRERKQYKDEYKKYLDSYDVMRYNENVNTDLTIQRSGGDDLSLFTEIVMRKQNHKLFEDHEESSHHVDSFHTDSDHELSQVDESNRSESNTEVQSNNSHSGKGVPNKLSKKRSSYFSQRKDESSQERSNIPRHHGTEKFARTTSLTSMSEFRPQNTIKSPPQKAGSSQQSFQRRTNIVHKKSSNLTIGTNEHQEQNQ